MTDLFEDKTKNSDDDIYVQSVSYNDNFYTKSYITHSMIMDGGELIFNMGDEPNYEFGNKNEDRPYQKITDNIIVPVPYFTADSKTFTSKLEVTVNDISNNATIWVSQPESDQEKYTAPIHVQESKFLSAYADINGKKSFAETADFIKIPLGQSITVNTEYSPQYTAGGDIALINTIRGGENFRTGNWQGYYYS